MHTKIVKQKCVQNYSLLKANATKLVAASSLREGGWMCLYPLSSINQFINQLSDNDMNNN